jgi:hypothetical protein
MNEEPLIGTPGDGSAFACLVLGFPVAGALPPVILRAGFLSSWTPGYVILSAGAQRRDLCRGTVHRSEAKGAAEILRPAASGWHRRGACRLQRGGALRRTSGKGAMEGKARRDDKPKR